MHPNLQKLVALQELDQKRQALGSILKKRPAEVDSAKKRAAAAAQVLKDKENWIAETKRKIDRMDLDIKGINKRIEDLLIKQKSIKNNKEYQAIDHEVLVLKADRSRIEEHVLAFFEEVEQGEKEIETLKIDLQDVEKDVAEREKEIEADLAESKDEMRRLDVMRKKAFEELREDHAAAYARLARRDGRAVVPIVDGTCQGCFMRVPSEVLSKLLANRPDIVYCRSCGRILYLADAERESKQ